MSAKTKIKNMKFWRNCDQNLKHQGMKCFFSGQNIFIIIKRNLIYQKINPYPRNCISLFLYNLFKYLKFFSGTPILCHYLIAYFWGLDKKFEIMLSRHFFKLFIKSKNLKWRYLGHPWLWWPKISKIIN